MTAWGRFPDLSKCGDCGTLQREPAPSDEELAQIYSRQYYDSWGEDESENLYWEMKKALFGRMIDYADINPAASIKALDVGCATGACLEVFKERGFLAYGVDVNPYAVDKARARVPGAAVHHGALEDASFEPDTFNLIVLSDVVEHVKNPALFLRGAYQALAPGGRVVILTPDIGSPSLFILGARWPHFKKEHLCYFNTRALKRLLDQCGFRWIKSGSARKPINFSYALRQFSTYPMPVISGMMRFMNHLVRGPVRTRHFFLPMGELLAVAEKPIDARRPV